MEDVCETNYFRVKDNGGVVDHIFATLCRPQTDFGIGRPGVCSQIVDTREISTVGREVLAGFGLEMRGERRTRNERITELEKLYERRDLTAVTIRY